VKHKLLLWQVNCTSAAVPHSSVSYLGQDADIRHWARMRLNCGRLKQQRIRATLCSARQTINKGVWRMRLLLRTVVHSSLSPLTGAYTVLVHQFTVAPVAGGSAVTLFLKADYGVMFLFMPLCLPRLEWLSKHDRLLCMANWIVTVIRTMQMMRILWIQQLSHFNLCITPKFQSTMHAWLGTALTTDCRLAFHT